MEQKSNKKRTTTKRYKGKDPWHTSEAKAGNGPGRSKEDRRTSERYAAAQRQQRNAVSSRPGQPVIPPKRRKKRSNLQRYFLLVATFVCLFLCAAVGVLAATGFFSQEEKTAQTPEDPAEKTQTPSEASDGGAVAAETEAETEHLNIAVFGVDRDGYRTDVMFIVSYDEAEGTLDLLSIPRDTKVTMTDEIQQSLNDRERGYPTGGVCKLNEVSAYAGSGYRYQFTVLQLEDLLGIEIDNYVKVDLDGFVALVDAVGGVEVDVPEDMDYDDPYQDLHIHLQAGPQLLDGAHAEQLVRFREGYAQKDLQRIQVQQLFLKALLQKVCSTETILSNLPSLVYTAFKYVETDLTVGDALEYIDIVKNLNLDKVNMETAPGEGGSYFTIDEAALEEQVQRIFYDVEEEPEPETVSGDGANSSKGYRIEVSNGSQTDGLAAQTQERLENEGYYVAGISTYYGEKTEETRIFVSRDGLGQDLLAYFPGAVIETAPDELSQGTDIKIILGANET